MIPPEVGTLEGLIWYVCVLCDGVGVAPASLELNLMHIGVGMEDTGNMFNVEVSIAKISAISLSFSHGLASSLLMVYSCTPVL
jgi:uncharacterized protein YejL (UPF0352 family)